MKNIVILCSSLLLFFSCRKDEEYIPDNIVAGQTENMKVVELNKALTTCPTCYNSTFYLDANNDGMNDFRIVCGNYPSFYTGSSFYNLASENDAAEFLIQREKSLIYLKKDTTYSDTTLSTGQHTVQYLHDYNSCFPITNEASIVNVTFYDVIPLAEGDLIKKSGQDWSNSASQLIDDANLYQSGPTNVSNPDTAQVMIIHQDRSCNSFPMNQVKYLGFKITIDENEKLGWIKIKISEWEIFIESYAIQE